MSVIVPEDIRPSATARDGAGGDRRRMFGDAIEICWSKTSPKMWI
jgi:hypothetical protein